MPEPPIPPGQMAFLPTVTGYLDASEFPAAGLAVRHTGEIAILGGGEAMVARLAPDDLERLGEVLIAVADALRAEIADTALAALDTLVEARPEGRA